MSNPINDFIQTIPCPSCQEGTIHFNTYQLLQGVEFACPNCSSKIGLAEESMGVVTDAMKSFEQLKKKVAASKKE